MKVKPLSTFLTPDRSYLLASNFNILADKNENEKSEYAHAPAVSFQVQQDVPVHPTIEWDKTIGGNGHDAPTNASALPTDYAGRQLPAGMYTLNVTPFSKDKEGNAITVSFEVTDAFVISGFTLINATLDQAVGELSQGDIIDLASFDNHQLSIRADAEPMYVDEVTFSLQGPIKRSRTEQVDPYALFGDVSAPDGSPNYTGLKWKPGTYTLTATPYTDGSMGVSSTITFTVIDSEGSSPEATARQVDVYPVPTSGMINILHEGVAEETHLMLLDFRGKMLLHQPMSQQPLEQVDLSTFKKGVYYLRVVNAEAVQVFRVVE